MKGIKLILVALTAFVTLATFTAPVTAAEHGVHWLTYEQGLKKQKELQKPMLLLFHLPYCYRCKEMERKVYQDPEVISFVNQHFIPVEVDLDKEKPTAKLFEVDYTPTHIFIAPDGSAVLREKDVIAKSQFERMLEFVAEQKYKTMNFDAYEKCRP
ncbi:periplasmic thioredoxin, putative [Syntrophotalea carbinolica DSM 2380]|uniref:Periplasmic thioredoxin, putative n=1 Tax=Syntrophotalea carbinolica (strain DSM 2380 / NBRC 103641 / GraBd1) TaxID=338963 RepID=Q3A7F7_SYNC1|nr:thioredoxin family protein [Syntrophotalea carbinolica]ABA87687.1 periplasmic thioredoxin, putative [Syntrophotalea carbinolica DSM 2380]